METIYPIFYNDIIVFSYKNHKDSIGIRAINIKEGDIVWDIKQYVSDGKSLYYNLKPYINTNFLIIPCNNELIAIDLDKGQIKWKITHYDDAENFLESIGNKIFRTYYDYVKKQYFILMFDIETGMSKVVAQGKVLEGTKLFCRSPVPIFYNNDTLLFYSSIQQNISNRNTIPMIKVFSIKHGQNIMEDTLNINNLGNGITKQPLVCNDKIVFLNDRQVLIYNWKNQFIQDTINMPRDMLTSRPLIQENILYYAAEDGFLYAIELVKNTIVWKTKISGTPSQLRNVGNQLFVVGGGNGIFYAINKKNGFIDFTIPSEKQQYSFERSFAINNNKIILFDKGVLHCFLY